MKTKDAEISQEAFDKKLEEILGESTGADLLSIPGIYEVVSEYFNNEVLDALKEEEKEEEEELRTFNVTWEIEVEARTPRDAARLALDIQRDQESDAVVFVVSDPREQTDFEVDLSTEEDD